MRSIALLTILSGLLNVSDAKSLGESRIVGGVPVEDVTSVSWYAHTNGEFLCGGVLLEGGVILTAAHCGFEAFKDGVTLRSTQRYQGVQSGVDAVLVHPEFDDPFHDIMLVKLSRIIHGIPAISFENSPSVKVGDNLTVIGYGYTAENGTLPNTLQQANVHMMDDKDCYDFYEYYDNDNMICAGVKEGGRDACQGDSGGPLLDLSSPNEPVVVGITSFGYGCGREGAPSGYTDVASHVSWIREGICALSRMPPSYCEDEMLAEARQREAENPSATPSSSPSALPSGGPSSVPTIRPSKHVSSMPTVSPSHKTPPTRPSLLRHPSSQRKNVGLVCSLDQIAPNQRLTLSCRMHFFSSRSHAIACSLNGVGQW